ncbi:MAG: leucine-rich repeat domain-containing protein [Lachnospiraceae bacterium]|nr:leucine-rich repeat domain-containing protein [Lachnospiraceae bacterium]
MKKLLLIISIFISCFCICSIFPEHATAVKRNAGDVAKLQKIVNAQHKSSLSKNVKTDKCYTWDKNGYLKSIEWDACGLSGSIKIPSFKKLKSIYIHDTTMLKVLKIANNKSLKSFVCYSNPFGRDEQDKNYGLNRLEIKGCHNLRHLAAGGNNKNSFKPDLSNYPELKHLSLELSYIKRLDLSKNKQLINLNLADNNMETINLANNRKIKELNLSNNKLNALDISNLTNLRVLYCSNNQIPTLDLTNNKKLKELSCYNNKITELDIHNCIKLQDYNVYPYNTIIHDVNVKIRKRAHNPASWFYL